MLTDNDRTLLAGFEILGQTKPPPRKHILPHIQRDLMDGHFFCLTHESALGTHRKIGVRQSADDLFPKAITLRHRVLLELRDR